MKRLFNLGIDESNPAYLNSKIRLSNIISITIGTIITPPFIVISALAVEPLTWMPILATIIAWLIPLMNRLKLYYLSRYIIGLLPITLASFYHAAMVDGNGDWLATMFMVQVGFAAVPFLTFDLRERGHLLFTSAVVVLYFVLFDLLAANYAVPGIDRSILAQGIMANMVILMGVFLVFTGIFVQAKLAYDAELETDKLVKSLQENKDQVEQSQKELTDNMEMLSRAREEEEQRNWSGNGRNKLSEILRESQGDEKVYDKAVSFIVKYMKVNQGGLYLIQEEDGSEYIELKSSYAYDRKKHQEQRIEPGQGLIGQCYYEKEMIYIRQVPQGYVTITSGLGESTPSVILIMPMIFNEKINGFIELASFHELKTHELDFIKDVSVDLASFVFNYKINLKTKRLLEESQQYQEQMRAQEEELRQNMEELQATQEEVLRKNKESETLLIQTEQKSKSIKLLLDVAKNVNKSANVYDACITALMSICKYNKWSLGHIYLVQENELKSTQLWYKSDSKKFEGFIRVSEAAPLAQGEGLAGNSWKNEKLIWVEEIPKSNVFIRKEDAALAGLKSAVAMPVKENNKVIGVMEFLSVASIQKDDETIHIMNELSEIIGGVIGRNKDQLVV